MSPRTEAQNKAIQEATKSKIIDAAIKLFAEQGYDKTSIRQLSQEAGISQGLLYNYFDSKEHLLVEIMRRGMVYIAEAFEDIPLEEPPLEQLESLVRQMFVVLEDRTPFWRVFYSLRNIPAFKVVLGDEIIERNNELRPFFQQFYESAGLDDHEIRAWLLYAMIEGVIQQYLLFGKSYPLAKVVDQVVNIHIHGAI